MTLSPTRLSNDDRQNCLENVPSWTYTSIEDAITRQFDFDSFKSAFAFMAKIAELAEEINHHPEWSNVYNKVFIKLTTHDCNGLSQDDINMAIKIDKLHQDHKNPT